MNILIAGGTGFIGKALITSLPNHTITVLSRSHKHVESVFGKKVSSCTWEALPTFDLTPFDVIINLAGHNIADGRWTEKTKRLIIDSRVNTNAMLINRLIQANAKPHFYSANAVGIYGTQDNNDPKAYDESTAIDMDQPKDFLSEVGILWQQSLQPAIDYGIPVTITRFGVVLDQGEGMLKKLELPFKMGLGSVIGDGQQVLSWIYIEDIVRAYQYLLQDPSQTGAFNLTSPNPVTQAEFAQTLANTLHRPLLLKTPAFVTRFLFGEMGEYLINRGQRVLPKRLPEIGFEFKYPKIEQALQKAFERDQ